VVHRLTGLIAVRPLVQRERNIGLALGRADLLREGTANLPPGDYTIYVFSCTGGTAKPALKVATK